MNIRRLKLSPFHNRRQLKKFNRLLNGLATSPQLKRDCGLVSVLDQASASRVHMECIVVGSGCLFMSLFLIAMTLVAGTN